MSQEQFERFRKLVLEDLELQEDLRRFADREAFATRAVELGAARGFYFTAEDVIEAIRASRREWFERPI